MVIITDYSFIIDTMTWSFSRLNSFYNCPYEWMLGYIMCEPRTDNFHAQFGTLCHEILEEYAKGNIDVFSLPSVYEERFSEFITMDAPKIKGVSIRDSYFEKGKKYFENINLDFEKYEILGVEKRVDFEVDGIPMVGYIDLLLKDKNTGEITILDHKSGSLKFKKNGELSKSKDNEKHFLEFKRQLYLYSIAIIEEYGSVDYLEWNLFKDRSSYRIKWNKEDFEEAKKWAIDTIDLIKKESIWGVNKNFYYCNNLCSQRNNCPNKN